jgi:hypothetical protein
MKKQYFVNVKYMDGSSGTYHMPTLKAAKSIYKMYLSDMLLLNVKSVEWSVR